MRKQKRGENHYDLLIISKKNAEDALCCEKKCIFAKEKSAVYDDQSHAKSCVDKDEESKNTANYYNEIIRHRTWM